MTSTATGFTPELDDLQIVAEYSASGTGEDSTLYILARKMSNNNFCEGLDRAMHIYIAKSRMSTKFIMNKLMEKAK